MTDTFEESFENIVARAERKMQSPKIEAFILYIASEPSNDTQINIKKYFSKEWVILFGKEQKSGRNYASFSKLTSVSKWGKT
jgi:hypothetical protein